jgi:hypothetical protein
MRMSQPRWPQASSVSLQITARGAVIAMLAMFLVGNLAADWLHVEVLIGLTFVAGCLLAAGYTQRRDLLMVVTLPPLVFFIAVCCAEALTSPGSTFADSVAAIAAGIFLTLAAAAPWLFGGIILALIIAVFRGLPQSVRDLRAHLRDGVWPELAGNGRRAGPVASRSPAAESPAATDRRRAGA